jgi:hypothetical protein
MMIKKLIQTLLQTPVRFFGINYDSRFKRKTTTAHPGSQSSCRWSKLRPATIPHLQALKIQREEVKHNFNSDPRW